MPIIVVTRLRLRDPAMVSGMTCRAGGSLVRGFGQPGRAARRMTGSSRSVFCWYFA